MILSSVGKYEEIQELATGVSSGKSNLVFKSPVIRTGTEKEIRKQTNDELEKTLKNTTLSENERKQLEKTKRLIANDSLKITTKGKGDNDDSTLEITKMNNFRDKHPNASINEALDSLNLKNNFRNRFAYRKSGILSAFMTNPETAFAEFGQELISYASISIFIFLPLFTLFMSLLYVRRKFTYVEHLIFVFHTQTVFFILLTLFYLIWFFIDADVSKTSWVFSIIFLLYLYIGLKKFYQQGYIKTFIKFIILNIAFLFFGAIGMSIVSAIAFFLY